MDKNKCTSCGEPKCSCKNKDFTKAVIEIDNPEQITLMRKVVIPASMGDDTTVPPVAGKYHNVLLYYEANSKSYLYSSDGIPTLLANGLTDYEQAVNLPQINGVTLVGDKTATQLGLQDKLTAGDGIEIDGSNTISISDIEQYAHFFDTVADMKAATNLKAGDYAKTGGFHSLNDGGGALYKITDTGTANEMDVIAVGSLYANLILEDGINVKQLGAYGDNVHNDTNILKAAFSKENVRIYIPNGTYRLDESLTLLSNNILCGDGWGSKIRWVSNDSNDYIINVPITTTGSMIRDITLDGNLRCNGIYDGKDRDGTASTRLSIINVRIILCKTGIYLNAMGSTVDRCYLQGNSTNDNSGGMDTGIYINSSDNGISNTRIFGFSNYGIYNNSNATRISDVKSYLNGVGFYFTSAGHSVSCVEAQENFYDNFQLYDVHGSSFDIMSGGAGIEPRNGQPYPLPTTLNAYSHIKIEGCDSTTINAVFNSRAAYGTRTWSCEGNIIKLRESIGVEINASSFTLNKSTALPTLVNADNIAGNKIIINGYEYFNEMSKQTITLHGTTNCTLNSTSGDNYDVTIDPGATGGVGFIWFDYFQCDKIAIYNMINEAIIFTNINFRYKVSGTYYNIKLEPSFICKTTSNLSTCRVIADIADLLANDEQYQEFISQGATITEESIILVISLESGSVISSRENIKGLIEVYAD